jgi:hypothetical protein
MPFDMWKVGNINSITKMHIVKVQNYYKAKVIGYSNTPTEKKVQVIEESTFTTFEPLLSPILKEVPESDERLRMGIELFTQLNSK